MGSLPNLHELCRQEEHANLPLHKHHHHQLDKNRLPVQRAHGQHQKVFKSKSNGNTTHIWDDPLLEQMASYSPISSRSTRNLTHNISRRRDSMNSSIGATSVRRLISVVRNTHSRYGPVYSKKILLKNLVVVCLSHALISAAFYPFLALQSSVSVWHYPMQNGNAFITANINVGSLLLAISYLFAAISTLLGPSFVHKLGANAVLFIFYVVLIIFYGSHFYPILYMLVPSYVMFGLALGPVSSSRITFLMTLSSKLSYADEEDAKNHRKTCVIRRVARSFQAAQDVGLIIGSILTALIISLSFNPSTQFTYSYDGLMNPNSTAKPCSSDNNNCTAVPTPCTDSNDIPKTPYNESCISSNNKTGIINNNNNNNNRIVEESPFVFDYNTFMDNIFDVDETGDRLCGSKACPSHFVVSYNSTEYNVLRVLPAKTADIITGLYVTLSLLALVTAVISLDRIRLYVCQDPLERPEALAALKAVRESFKDVRLQLAAPLAVFIGMEQAFMFSDFSKSYVVCTLGIHRLNLVFLCMGLLQSIAACTLSMLLRTIQRYIVIAVGFAFHACLLMVQLLWKPSGDDPALFYVISAAWGVCNAIWEMLNFTLLTGQYTENWESAFANSTFFRHIGLALAFALHGLLCNWMKLYLLAAFMVLATIPYTWLEVKLENIRKIKNISRL